MWIPLPWVWIWCRHHKVTGHAYPLLLYWHYNKRVNELCIYLLSCHDGFYYKHYNIVRKEQDRIKLLPCSLNDKYFTHGSISYYVHCVFCCHSIPMQQWIRNILDVTTFINYVIMGDCHLHPLLGGHWCLLCGFPCNHHASTKRWALYGKRLYWKAVQPSMFPTHSR